LFGVWLFSFSKLPTTKRASFFSTNFRTLSLKPAKNHAESQFSAE